MGPGGRMGRNCDGLERRDRNIDNYQRRDYCLSCSHKTGYAVFAVCR